MEFVLIILGLAIFGALIFLIFQIKGNSTNGEGEKQTEELLRNYLESLRKDMGEHARLGRDEMRKEREEIDKKMQYINEHISKHQQHSQEVMQKQFMQSRAIFKEVNEKLTTLDLTNKQVVGFAEQMKSLENILKNPKQRGILGEYFLESLLANVLPPNQYKMQYKFKDGEIVDAAIFFKDKIIPIDAKFSLEKYNLIMQENDKIRRDQLEKEFKGDLKNRIDETSKYIRPGEDTTEFAFMFLPAEGIYYNLLIYNVGTVEVNTQDLIEYAFKKKVIIVSPTSFYAYLETVLQGLKALKMEESVKEIIKRVGELGRHINSYDLFLQKLGGHLANTVSSYNSASREFKKIDKDVYKITDREVGGQIELIALDKPCAD